MASIATLDAPEFAKRLPGAEGFAPDLRAGGLGEGAKPRRGVALFALLTTLYVAVGLSLILVAGYHNGDAEGRTANAAYVLFSRDPHLAAIGFVWNPLPSLAEIPILAFKPLWPALETKALAGPLMSAPFMAGAALQIRGILRHRGLSWPWVAGLTAGFALNPLIILYAANGQSEAPFIFCTTWAVHRLMRWLDTDRVADLVVAGIALGLDFLTRYETTAIAAAAAVLVCFITSTRSTTETRGEAVRLGLIDACIVTLPFVLSFVGWALAGWVLTGTAFSQFSSVYGNSSQISLGVGGASRPVLPAIVEVAHQVVVMQALLPLSVLLALFLAVRRRDLACLPAVFLFGGGISFVALSYVTGSIIGNLRYYSLEIPLMIVMVAMLPSVETARPHLGGSTSILAPWPTSSHRRSSAIAGGLVLILVAGSIPLMLTGVQDPAVDPSDFGVRSVLAPARFPLALSGESSGLSYGTAISTYVATLGLRDGAVLLDTWAGFTIAMSAPQMRTYTITSDLDFTAALNDPVRFGVQYFLVPSTTGVGALDSINRRYPLFWRTGSGFARLVVAFTPPQPSLPGWRLYRITAPDGADRSVS